MNFKVGDKVNPDQRITELDSGLELKIKSVWPAGTSTCIDFVAVYPFILGKDPNGNDVFTSRGFAYKDEGLTWERKKQFDSAHMEG